MRSWPSAFVRVCGAVSLCGGLAAAQDTTLVLLSGAADSPWPAIAAETGWRLVRPDLSKAPPAWTDAGLSAILPAAERRVFLIAEHDLAAAAFYAASRTPHAWMATVAIGGSPRAAVATNRLYAANTNLTPVLWISEQADPRLERGKFNVEIRPTATGKDVVDWLNARQREAFPPEVDCETGNPKFARCFWAEITGFDARRRNDVLDSTRIWAGSGAYLDLGGFGFQPGAPGPGVEVAWLPPRYSGPLRLGDRLVAVAGREIHDSDDYAAFMDQQVDGKPAAVMVVRGKERKRIETHIIVTPREELTTARIRAQFLQEAREILLITRQVSALRVRIPEHWSGMAASWNGQDLGKLETGCWNIGDEGAGRCE